jgi:predicted transposase/invertase (TIGR01784 family)
MDLPIESFEELVLLNTELNQDSIDQKLSRLDLRIKLKDKVEIDVEIQVNEHLAYKERVLYYWSKMYGSSISKGDTYGTLKKCVIINIIYFELFNTPRMHTKFQILETKEHIKFSDHLEIHVLELSKLNAYNRAIESDLLIDWAEFLSLRNEDELMNYKDRTDLPDDVMKAIEEFERIKDDPTLQMEALNKQIAILDYIQGLEDATNKGITMTLHENAKKMKALGISLEDIKAVTGLDINIIENL